MSQLKAPNGKPSNLTPEQWKLVRTPQFKAWFGDWENDPENASKVVDENGEPLVVYHGTNNQFTKFKLNPRADSIKNNLYQTGLWFFAPSFDKSMNENERAYFYKKGNAEFMAETWMANKDEKGNLIENKVIKAFLNVRKPKIVNGLTDFQAEELVYYSEKMRQLKKNDAVIMHGCVTDGNVFRDDINVLEPNQIKLADGSNTNFDSNNPDIRFAEGGSLPNYLHILIEDVNPEKKYFGQYKKIFDIIEEDITLYNPYGTEDEKIIGNDFHIWISPIPDNDKVEQIKKLKGVKVLSNYYAEGGTMNTIQQGDALIYKDSEFLDFDSVIYVENVTENANGTLVSLSNGQTMFITQVLKKFRKANQDEIDRSEIMSKEIFSKGGKTKRTYSIQTKNSENYGKPKDFDEQVFVHQTTKENGEKIIKNGFNGSSNPNITNGVYSQPETWSDGKLSSQWNFIIKFKLKKNSKIFWTDSERPTDFVYGFGNNFYKKIYKKLNEGQLNAYESIKLGEEEAIEHRKKFLRNFEKWLNANDYVGVQQGGEVVITDLKSIEIIDSQELFSKGGKTKRYMKKIKRGGITYGKSHAEGGIPVKNQSTGDMLEVEGGEGIVNKRSMASKSRVKLNGKDMSICEAVSQLNQMEGGVQFSCEDVSDRQFLKAMAKGGELDRGTRTEQEHIQVLKDLYAKRLTPKQASERIAKDHLKEDSRYYSKLAKMEGKMAKGGKTKIESPLEFYDWVKFSNGDVFQVRGIEKDEITLVSNSSDGGNVKFSEIEKMLKSGQLKVLKVNFEPSNEEIEFAKKIGFTNVEKGKIWMFRYEVNDLKHWGSISKNENTNSIILSRNHEYYTSAGINSAGFKRNFESYFSALKFTNEINEKKGLKMADGGKTHKKAKTTLKEAVGFDIDSIDISKL